MTFPVGARPRRGLLVACGVFATALAALTSAMAADPTHDERERIGAARKAAEARYAVRERECRGRFVVTSCIDDAKRERREALDQLRSQQLVVDEARRKQRAADRQAELAAKAVEDARRDAERERAEASRTAASGAPPPSRRPSPLRIGRRGAASEPPHAANAASATQAQAIDERRARETKRRAAYDARQQRAEAHRRAVEEKNAKRPASRKPAAPLPVPAASGPASAPGR